MSIHKTASKINIGYRSIDKRNILLALVIFIILCTTGIIALAYAGIYNAAVKNYHEKNNSQFSLYRRSLLYEMELILNTGNRLQTDTSLTTYLSNSKNNTGDIRTAVRSLSDTLHDRSRISRAIKHLGFYFVETGTIIDTKGSQSANSFLNSFTFDGYSYNQLYELLNKQQRGETITIKSTDSDSENLICLITNSILENSKFSIITCLIPEKLDLIETEDTGDVFVYSEEAGIISSAGGSQQLPAEIVSRMISQKSGSLPFNSAGRDFYLYYDYYKPLQWYYGYLVPQATLKLQLHGYMLQAVIVIFLLLLSGASLVIVTRLILYNPLRMLPLRIKSEKAKAITEKPYEISQISMGYSDHNSILHKHNEDSRAILKAGFLKDLLYGNQWTQSEEIAKSLNISFKQKYVQVLVLDIDELDMFDYNRAGEVTSLLKQEILATTEFYFRKLYPCEVVEPSFGKIAVILNYDSENPGLSDIIRELQVLAKEKLNIIVTASIGNKYENVRDLPVSFREAMQVLEYKYALGRGKILHLADIEAFSNDSFYYPLERERFVINAAINGDYKAVKSAVEHVIEDNFENRNLKPEVRYHLLSAIAGTIIRILHAINTTSQEIFGKDYEIYNEIRDFKDTSVFRDKLLNICLNLCTKAQETQTRTGDKLKKKMLDCIMNNFHRYDFSLNDMAEQFNFSSTYFSDLFKEHTGENFIDYLIGYRMSKAKELMSETNYKIHEIAGKVGYNNTTSFIRAFKKYEGVSPGKFKEINF